MPQKRRSNAAKADVRAPSASATASIQNDVFGVGLAVVAVAMLVSLVAPSGAVVTHVVERALTLAFGVGAFLCPVTLFLFALTFFVEGEEPFGARAAIGLALVTFAVLGLISLFVPGADADANLVIERGMVEQAGGYVGGGLAWLMLKLVGKWVGLVLIVGLAVLGIIVCGFSVSDFVVRVQEGAVHMSNVRTTAREQRVAMREATRRAAELTPAPAAAVASAGAAAETTFIGERMTSVLTRAKNRVRKVREGQAKISYDEEKQPEVTGEADTPKTAARPVRKQAARQEATSAEPEVGRTLRRNESSAQDRLEPDQGARGAGSSERRERKRKVKVAQREAADAAKATDELSVPEFLRHPKATQQKAKATRPGEGTEGYELPPLDMLKRSPNQRSSAASTDELDETRDRLQGTLREFGLTSRVVDYVEGPIVTTFRVEMGEGERVSRIRNLEDDIALTLAAEKVRIFAPIPGTSYVGIEIPNKRRQNVQLGDVLPFASGGPLEVAIGRDSSGTPVVADIAKMPHMLVAGTTGSGKSVMINSMIMSLLMRTTPKQVRLIMIDPKRVEFSCYNGLPHLYVPVVTEPRQAASALSWAVSEMENRLRRFERAGAREINTYNRMVASGKLADAVPPAEPLPYLVVIIDELSDLMMVAGKDVEASIVRIAQLARAAGIHLVIATQRPSANVVTGLIKSNIDNRVALKVSSGIDSRVILDETGAERLLGNGDMLFKYRGLNMQRVLGCYTSDAEINEVVDFIRAQAEPDYHEEILTAVVPGQPAAPGGALEGDEDDPLVWEAAQIVVESRLGSTSGLQRRLKVGYARAGRIMDMLAAKGVVGPPDGSKPREVLLDEEGLEELKLAEARYREVS